MSAPGIIKWIGAALLLAGLIVGFVPVSSGGVSCGGAFWESSDARVDDLVRTMRADSLGIGHLDELSPAEDACDSLRSVVLIPAAVLGGLGLVGFITGVAMSSRQPARR